MCPEILLPMLKARKSCLATLEACKKGREEAGSYVLPFFAAVNKSWISTSFMSFSILNGLTAIAFIKSTIIN